MVLTLQEEHDTLLAGLAARVSVKHFAHCAISLVVGGIWGATVFQFGLGLVPTVMASALLVYSAVRGGLAVGAYRDEHRAVRRLFELRDALESNPSALSGAR